MRRGTRVGNAYVAVTADGDGINEEIVDSVDAAGEDIEKAGKDHGDRYGDEFGDSLRVKFSHAAEQAGEELSKRLNKQAEVAGDDFGKRFEKSMKKSVKRVGANISDSLRDAFDDQLEALGRMIDVLESRMSSVSRNSGGGSGVGGGVGAGSQQPDAPQTLYNNYDFASLFEATRIKMHRDANKAIEADDAKLIKSQQSLYNMVLRMEENKTAFLAKFEAARVKVRENSNEAILKDDRQLVKDQEKLFDRLVSDATKRDADMWKVRNASAKAHYKYLLDLEKGTIDKFGNAIRRSRGSEDGIGGTIGRMFGAGSRSNTLNLIGRTLGNLVGLVDKARASGSRMFSTFTKGFASAAEGANIFQKTLSGFKAVGGGAGGISGFFAGIARAGPAAAAAIIIVVAALSAMVSVVSALTGLVVALSATIVSGLTGALLVVGAAFAPVIAGAGLLAVAFTSMTDAQSKALSTAFKPLKAELTGLGQLMVQDLIPHFETWSKNLQDALYLAAPVATVMGEAFGKAGDSLTKSLSGPGFQRFFDMLARELPAITQNFSTAFGSALNGLAGVFAALMPFVTQFSEYLVRVTDQFSDWANSTEGQNAIVDFTERALESLKSLWGFVKEFSGFIKDVLFNPNSQEAGNSLFDSLKESFEGFRKKFKEAARDGSLKKWFDDAIEFGGRLKDLIVALKDTFVRLDNSGVLDAVGKGLGALADFIREANKVLKPLVDYLGVALPAAADAAQFAVDNLTFGGLLGHLEGVIGKVGDLIGLLGKIPGVPGGDSGGGSGGNGGGSWGGGDDDKVPSAPGPLVRLAPSARVLASTTLHRRSTDSGGGSHGGPHIPTLQELIAMGNNALNHTSADNGGNKGSGGGSGSGSGSGSDDDKKKWHNPYIKWARSLIDEGPTVAQMLKQALKKMNREVVGILSEASRAVDSAAARSLLMTQAQGLREAGRSGVDLARGALNTAAENLAGATNKKQARRALAEVVRAQKDLATALKNQERLNKAAERLGKQRLVDQGNVADLLAGLTVENATLADYAAARSRLAEQIDKANDKLADAIQMHDSFRTQVSDSIKAFGDLTTAQVETIDGIEQALSAGTIVSNLQDRLGQIKTFQDNLRILLSRGLSNAAYQQIIARGVEGGSAYAQALVDGGMGAVGQVNDLLSQIGGIADTLGLEAADQMYSAGVQAAQGIVDGLLSLSDDLNTAATALGNSIAAAIAKALGIKSPSTRMRTLMGPVGDGAVLGLDDQHVKVSEAAARLSGLIAVSPEVAAYEARLRGEGVSGNPVVNDVDIQIITPTEDPHAVALEVMNEVVERLP